MKRSDVTYGQLHKVLRALGFTYRLMNDEPPPTRAYYHREAGALIMLPAHPESEKVMKHHLIDTQVQLDNFGIADPALFAEKLQLAS